MLTLLDTLLHEYGWSIEYTMEIPLSQAYALYAAIDARYGNEPKGPSYKDRELIKALLAAGPL